MDIVTFILQSDSPGKRKGTLEVHEQMQILIIKRQELHENHSLFSFKETIIPAAKQNGQQNTKQQQKNNSFFDPLRHQQWI